jgi:hypothetical protein
MDQPTPDQPTPEQPPSETVDATEAVESAAGTEAAGITPDPTTASAPVGATGPTPAPQTREDRIGARLQRLVGTDEIVVAWTRGWVSREVRLHRLLAARTLDFAVVTNQSLQLYSTGFFTRRARRRVYNSRFERLFVADDEVRRGRRRLRVTSRTAKPLWFELDASERAITFADELIDRARTDQP